MAPYGQQRVLSIQQCLCHLSSPVHELLRFPPPNRLCPGHNQASICAHSELCLAFPRRRVPVLTWGLGGAEVQSSAVQVSPQLGHVGADSWVGMVKNSPTVVQGEVSAVHYSGTHRWCPQSSGCLEMMLWGGTFQGSGASFGDLCPGCAC